MRIYTTILPKTIKKIYNFLNLKFNKKFLEDKNWNNQLLSKFNYINTTAYTNKKAIGFSKKEQQIGKRKSNHGRLL